MNKGTSGKRLAAGRLPVVFLYIFIAGLFLAAGARPALAEEAEEVRAELSAQHDPAEELGDLLFACVNVVRLAGCDPEEALTFATDKFVRRFTEMETRIINDGKSLKDLTLPEMDVYWNKVKQTGK